MKISKKSGFTLIELMVVIAIIGIMAGIAVVNFGRNPDRDVRLEKDRLVTFLRDVQNKALSGEKVSVASGKICGFGVFFEAEKKISVFYVHTKSGGLYPNKLDVPCENDVVAKKQVNWANSTFANSGESLVFKNDVIANSFSDIFFLSPNGEAYSDGSPISSDVQIKLTKTGLSSPIPVTITPGGIIK